MRNDKQTFRDAIEAAGLFSTEDGSGPIYNDVRKDGTRRLKLAQGGYLPLVPLETQWLIHDYLVMLFGERFVSVYLQKFNGNHMPSGCVCVDESRQENRFSLCVVLRD